MSRRELLPDRHEPQLPLNVPEMLKLTDVSANYIGSGCWFLRRGSADVTTDPFPNYEDFARDVQRLMQWKCSDKPPYVAVLGKRRR